MKRFITKSNELIKKKWSIPVWSVLIWLLIWQLCSMVINQGILLVSPVATIKRLYELVRELDFLVTILATVSHIITGFLAALLAGIVCAVAAKRFRIVEQFLQPMISTIKAVPVASFIILSLVFLPMEKLSVFIVFLMVFPIAYTNILQGIKSADGNLLEMAYIYEVPFRKRIRYIYLPAVTPYLYTACEVGIGFSFKSGIAAEVIGICTGTIGEKLYNAKIYLDTPDLFAWTVVIVVVSIVFEKVFLALIRFICSKVSGQDRKGS